MRRWLVPLTLLCAPVALAQGEAAPAEPVAVPAPEKAPEAPAEPAPAPAPPEPVEAPQAVEAAPPAEAEKPVERPAAPPPPKRTRPPAPPAPKRAARPAPVPDAGTAAPVAAPPRVPEEAAPRRSSEEMRGLAEEGARAFFAALVRGDVRAMADLAAYPFQLEGRRLASAEEFVREWARQLRDKRPDLLTLYGIEVLSAQEMERKYGKAPARLEGLELERPHTFAAVANLSGRPAVALLRATAEGMRAVAFTD